MWGVDRYSGRQMIRHNVTGEYSVLPRSATEWLLDADDDDVYIVENVPGPPHQLKASELLHWV